MEVSQITPENIIESLRLLNDPTSTSQNRKAADQYLFDCEKTSFVFLAFLLQIYQTHNNPTIRLQSLLYFNNIIKRNWNNKRLNKHSPNFQSDKSNIKSRLIHYLKTCDSTSRKSLLDIIVFISKFDFPHNFEPLCQFILEVYRSVNNSQVLMSGHIEYLKAVKEVYKGQMGRKSAVSRRIFGEGSMVVLSEAFQLFNRYSVRLDKPDGITENQWRVMRLNDKVMIMLLVTGPTEIVDIEDISKLVGMIEQKLTALVQIIATGHKTPSSQQIQKSIKSLLKYLGHLQTTHPFLFTPFLKTYLQILLYLYLNPTPNKDLLRFTIINLNKCMKCFNYYSDDNSFLASSHSKQNKSVQYAQLHAMCRAAYFEVFTQEVVERVLSQTILRTLGVREHELEVGCGVEEEDAKVEDQENTIFNLAMFLVDTMFARFSPFAVHLFRDLVVNSAQQNFANLNDQILCNVLSILSILPKSCKGQTAQVLNQIPIIPIIQHIHTTNKFKDKFALLCCKWLHRFTPDQLKGILTVLVSYTETQQKIQILLQCCLAIKTIVLQKSSQIDVAFAVQKIIPVAIRLCSTVDSVQVVWPMLTLLSKMISKVQFNLQLLLSAFTHQSLSHLLQSKSQLIVQALCDMLKTLICVFPRNMPIPVIYSMAFTFVENHVGYVNFASFPSVLAVWYIAIREYSGGLDGQAQGVFERCFRKLVGTQNQVLLYVLEEYVLMGLVREEVGGLLGILEEFYFQGEEDREEFVGLKTAVMSVHITFITKFGIEKAHSNQLLVKYLGDMARPDQSKTKSAAAFRNSLLTLINRYLILFKDGFLSFVDSIGLTSANFFPIWFAHMDYLTSRSACKINAIALLKMLNDLEISFIQNRLELIFKLIVPEVELFLKQDGAFAGSAGRIGVSPTYRLSENVLSERKEEIRRKGVFEEVNLAALYQQEVRKLFQRFGLTQEQILMQFVDKPLVYKLFSML